MTLKGMDRRRFLQVTGATAGLLATGPLLGEAAVRAASASSIRVGVLSATGGTYPNMSAGFQAGIGLRFAQARAASAPLTVSVMAQAIKGGHEGVYAASGALLRKGADVVIADVSAPIATAVAPLFADARVPLVVANAGGHVVRPRDRSAVVVHSSLMLWNASYALGAWAAAHVGKRGYALVSFADAGYDSLFAFRRGFEAAGGTLAGTAVTHRRPRQSGLASALAQAAASRPDFVFAHYSGPQAVDFLHAYASKGLHGHLPLLGSSFLVEDDVLPQVGRAALGAFTGASWTAALTTAANTAFGAAYRAATGRAPDPFAVLGYDAAGLVVQGAQLAAAHGQSARKLIAALVGATVAGVRGPLTLDAATNAFVGPLVIRQVQGSAHPANHVVATVPALSSFPAGLSAMETHPASGYVNEYLCA